MSDLALATIGDNNPPDDITILRERLEEEAAPLISRRDELLASVARAPAEIQDDLTCGKVADLVKLITACHKAADTQRTKRKEPFLESGRAVDGFYKRITEPLEQAKRGVEQRLTSYQRRKAEEERRRREEEARLAEQEAERQRQEAAEREASLSTDADLDAAITADELARQATVDAEKARQAVAAKPAELSRARGDYGALASLRTEWSGEIVSREDLDLNVLRQHIAIDALEKALRAFIRAGGRELKGAKIYERSISVVR